LPQFIHWLESQGFLAEGLRKKYKRVVFIVGNELLIDSRVIFDAPRVSQRVEFLKSYSNLKFGIKNEIPQLKKIYSPMRKFLKKTENSIKEFVETLRVEASKNFKGKITYASLQLEEINWNNFDIIGVNLYKHQWNASAYFNEIKRFKSFGKPVAITEFGTCAYKGASKLGGAAYAVVDYKTSTIKKGIIRDENEQAEYLAALIKLYSKENIFATFIFDFKEEWKIHSKNPKNDLDLSSFGIVKVSENGEVIPKKAFNVVRKLYSK